jgi:hypothetical protein
MVAQPAPLKSVAKNSCHGCAAMAHPMVPAASAMQPALVTAEMPKRPNGVQKDGRTVEAYSPTERREHKDRRDDPPAVIRLQRWRHGVFPVSAQESCERASADAFAVQFLTPRRLHDVLAAMLRKRLKHRRAIDRRIVTLDAVRSTDPTAIMKSRATCRLSLDDCDKPNSSWRWPWPRACRS